jgi:tRNA(Ile)-lysidine synthase
MPVLAEEGGDSRNLARLASRLARANAAIEVLADGAERYLALRDRNDASRFGFDATAFAGLAEEIRLRLLKRAIDRVGHEGPVELGKLEALLGALDQAIADGRPRLKQTLAGAVIGLGQGRIHVDPAPPRRRKIG